MPGRIRQFQGASANSALPWVLCRNLDFWGRKMGPMENLRALFGGSNLAKKLISGVQKTLEHDLGPYIYKFDRPWKNRFWPKSQKSSTMPIWRASEISTSPEISFQKKSSKIFKHFQFLFYPHISHRLCYRKPRSSWTETSNSSQPTEKYTYLRPARQQVWLENRHLEHIT